MTLTSIVLLILFGLILLLLEILFVPGMVLGFISVVLMIVGIIFSFIDYGTNIGITVLVSTGLATALAVYWAFNSSVWKKLQVHSTVDGKASSTPHVFVKPGDSGATISRLNPTGKVLINNIQAEAQALQGFIDEGKEITVVKVEQNKIFVKLK